MKKRLMYILVIVGFILFRFSTYAQNETVSLKFENVPSVAQLNQIYDFEITIDYDLSNEINLTPEVTISNSNTGIEVGYYDGTSISNLQDELNYYKGNGEFKLNGKNSYGYIFSVRLLNEGSYTVTLKLIDDATLSTVTEDSFTIQTPTTQPIVPTKNDVSTIPYDDGGPFTTDACGNVFDRWNNTIYQTNQCNSTNNYTVPYTADKS